MTGIVPGITIRADAGPKMGTGHVMRCLALARAAKESGLRVKLVARANVPWLRERLEKDIIPVSFLGGDAPEQEKPEDLLLQLGANPGCVVLDGYHFGLDCQRAAREAGNKLLVIDDFNHLPEYSCDFLLNQNAGAQSLSYAGAIGQKLMGPPYALLRTEFSEMARQNQTKAFAGQALHILLTLGGGDNLTHLAGLVSAFCLPELNGCTVRIIAGEMPPESIRALFSGCPATVDVLTRVDDMPAHMQWADLAISAGGSTCWELCSLGVPFLTVQVAENQELVCESLHSLGVAPRFTAQSFHSLLAAPLVRERAAQGGQGLVDGYGAKKVVQVLGGMPFLLRPPLQGDSEAVWALASSPSVRAISCSAEPIPWTNHQRWYAERLGEPFPLFIVAAEHSGKFCGYVRFTLDAGSATVSIALVEEKRGAGAGKALLSEACRLFWQRYPSHSLVALVHPDNSASVRLFQVSGFRQDGHLSTRGVEFLRFISKTGM